MNINKLSGCIKIPYELSKGTFAQRQAKSNVLSDVLYKNMCEQIHDDYSILSYENLQKLIVDVLPNKNLKIIIRNLSKKNCEGIFKIRYDKDNNMRDFLIQLNGISSTIRSRHVPAFIHEFQHLSDVLFHPKYLSRLQSLNKKGLVNKRYDKFYDSVYYANESAQTPQEKEELFKFIRNKTKKFLRKLNISDKMDYIQDMRYSLESEIAAYEMQRKVAADLRAKGVGVVDFDFYDYPQNALFKEKIELLKNLALEYISKERAK